MITFKDAVAEGMLPLSNELQDALYGFDDDLGILVGSAWPGGLVTGYLRATLQSPFESWTADTSFNMSIRYFAETVRDKDPYRNINQAQDMLSTFFFFLDQSDFVMIFY